MNNISISHLRKVYGPTVSGRRLSLEIPEASVFGVLGTQRRRQDDDV